MSTTPAVTTQQQHPGRATVRTVVQTVLSAVLVLGVVLPIVVSIIDEELGAHLPDGWVAWLYGAAALVAAVAGALSRIMQIPAVDGWLEKLRIGSAPDVDVTQTLTAAGRRSARILPVDPPDAPQV